MKEIDELVEKTAEALFTNRLKRENGLYEDQIGYWWEEGETFKNEIVVAREDAKQILFGNNLAIIKDDQLTVDKAIKAGYIIPLEAGE